MAYEESLQPKTFDAHADLSSSQYRIVKMTADRTVGTAGGSTDDIIGVLQGTPESGDSANVATGGITKVLAASSVSAGDLVTADSNGKATPVVAVSDVSDGDLSKMTKILGKVTEGAGADEYASVLIDKQIAG